MLRARPGKATCHRHIERDQKAGFQESRANGLKEGDGPCYLTVALILSFVTVCKVDLFFFLLGSFYPYLGQDTLKT
jgi:hypothetical protein